MLALVTSQTNVDVVVVGSGFGGAFAALQCARAGMRVLVLERGKAWPPGSFPRTPHEVDQAFWEPDHGRYGLFEAWSFRHMGAVVSAGLGGGSLIYANVLLRKDPETFGGWPITRSELDVYYNRVDDLIGTSTYNVERDYFGSAKAIRMVWAADQAGLPCERPPLAVTFASSGREGLGLPIRETIPNLHDAPRSTCRRCGECVIGCNYGAKNTLDLTVISLAKQLGATIEHSREVTYAKRTAGKKERFVVRYTDRSSDEGGPFPTGVVTCRYLVLAMGALGTTAFMLKHGRDLGVLSPLVGRGISSNGDFLGFVTDAKDDYGRPILIDASRGTTVTRAIRVVKPGTDGSRVHYVQDAGYPAAVAWAAQQIATSPTLPRRLVRGLLDLVRTRVGLQDTRSTDDIRRLLGDPRWSKSVLPLLGMGIDNATGTMTLKGDRIDVDWDPKQSAELFAEIRQTMQAIAKEFGGNYHDAPTDWLGRSTTVHPLGGCRMGADSREGVVDSYGRAFDTDGLVIADGSVLPGAVGANPALTIAAVAMRSADRLVDDWYASKDRPFRVMT